MPTILVAVLIVLVAVGAGATLGVPAAAAAPGEVTAIALDPAADCSEGRVQVDISSPAPAERERVLATTRGSQLPVTEFEQVSGVGTTYSGPFRLPFAAPLPDGTVVALYAYFGTTPPSADTTAELFLLYECRSGGGGVLLASCTGPYGSCPQTARAQPRIVSAPSEAVAGTTVVVTGLGCYADVAFASVAAPDQPPVAIAGPVSVGPDGSFTLPVPIPPDLGAIADVALSCGLPSAPVSDQPAFHRIVVLPADAGPGLDPVLPGDPAGPAGPPAVIGASSSLVLPKFTG